MDIFEIKNGGIVYKNGRAVEFKKTPNVSGRMNPRILVVHDTASPLDESGPINWLCNPQAKASAHFVVARSGRVVQLAPTNVKTWHAGKSSYYGERNVNNFSVGIEIVNPGVMTKRIGDTVYFGNSKIGYNIEEYGIQEIDPPWAGKAYWMPYTQEQIDAVTGIGQALKAAYNISDVTTHWFIAPGRKVDTNPHFPLDAVKSAVLYGARGPVVTALEEPVPANEAACTLAECDEHNPFDAIATVDLNLRPFPDSPNRIGIIGKDKPLDFLRVSKSQKDGAQWFFVSVPAASLSQFTGQADANGMVQGFVHSDYIKMVG